ncbi:MAG: hypothetical protein V1720_03635 [bacterium]
MKNKIYILFIIAFGLSLVAFTSDDLNPGYAKAFGWGSICVSKAGYPSFGSYDASQFDFDGNKFYVNPGGTLDLRAILPKGKNYGDLLIEFNNKHQEFSKKTEEQIYWKVYSDHDFVGNVLFDKWPAKPDDMLHSNNPLCFLRYNAEGEVRSWNSTGVRWEEPENNNDLKGDISNWLNSAKPGWQLYIFHTVGFQRKCPENKYWDYNQGKEVIPIAFEMAKPFAYTIVEVK